MKYFKNNGLYYLKINPGFKFGDDILINSAKANLNSFWLNGNWYGIEIYLYKQNNKININQYICSNTKEGITYLINLYSKLYENRVSFSKNINKKLVMFDKYVNKYQIGQVNNGVLQIKKMGSLGDNNFGSSISLNYGIIEDFSPFINENEIIKISFVFTKGSYSKIIKDYLYSKYSKSLNEEERNSFYKSFNESQNFFKFRYFIESNKKNNSSLLKIIEKNLMLYESLYNRYFIQKKKSLFSIVNEAKRIIQGEALLSQGLILPISNNNTHNQNIPIITTNNKLKQSGFII